jgi:transketolase
LDRCDNRGIFHLRAAARLDYGTASRINAATLRAAIGCDRYAGASATIVGMHSFGASGKFGDVLAKFGFR